MKKVAATLKEIQGSEIYARIMDPMDPLDDLIEKMKGWWKLDLFGRRPTAALVDERGELLKPTDLDLASFLAALASRNAVIKLPTYKIRRPRQLRDDEWVTSAENRHGKLCGLTSNKEVFSFSVLMIDANVVRLVFAVLAIVDGSGFALYVLAWLVMVRAGESTSILRRALARARAAKEIGIGV